MTSVGCGAVGKPILRVRPIGCATQDNQAARALGLVVVDRLAVGQSIFLRAAGENEAWRGRQ